MNTKHLILPLVPWVALACGDSLEPVDEPAPIDETESRIETTELGGGIFESRVDAQDREAWVYLSLRAGGDEIDVTDPLRDTGWDLGFRRSNLRLNGGASGGGEGAVSPLTGADFDALEQAPDGGWITDEAAASQGDDGSPVQSDGVDFAFTRSTDGSDNGWFIYDSALRVLSAAPIVWAVRSADGASYFAVQILDYYDEAGSSAVWTVRWKTIQPPDNAPQPGFLVDASSRTETTYLRFSPTLTIGSEPADALGWDLAIRRTQIQTNSAASGAGLGGAREAPEGATWIGLEASPTHGFVRDAMLPVPGPGGAEAPANPVLTGWYDYDPATRTASPRDVIFLFRTADGSYRKLRILDYQDGVYRMESAPVFASADVFRIEVDASDRMVPTRVSLEQGAVVDTATTSLDWDLAITRTVFQTNSGVSGPGEGGAVRLDAEAVMADVFEVQGGYEVDEMVDSERPGIPPAPANPILADWFDYDSSTRTVTPQDAVFGVRTARGDHALLRILSWDDGQYVLEARYAGPNEEVFR